MSDLSMMHARYQRAVRDWTHLKTRLEEQRRQADAAYERMVALEQELRDMGAEYA